MNPTTCFKHSNPPYSPFHVHTQTHTCSHTRARTHAHAHTHTHARAPPTPPLPLSPTPSLKSKRKNIVKLRGLNPETCDVETVRKIFHDHHSVTNVTFDKDGTARIMFADRKTAKVRKREKDEGREIRDRER